MDTQHKLRIGFGRKEAASRLGISVVTVDREVARRRMPHFRVGRRVLFTQELLDQYIEENTKETRGRGFRRSGGKL